VGQEKMGVPDESIIKAVSAFGGGIATTGRTCGALLGGIAFISSLYGLGNEREKDDPRMWRLARRLCRRFEEIAAPHGGIDCSDIARVNWTDKEAAREFRTNPDSRRRICAQVVGETAFALGEILEKDAG
jgi:C_GCAxxG_C_C family probable redox protein